MFLMNAGFFAIFQLIDVICWIFVGGAIIISLLLCALGFWVQKSNKAAHSQTEDKPPIKHIFEKGVWSVREPFLENGVWHVKDV